MKKMILSLCLFVAVALTNESFAQQKLRFYYYPSANVYYDVANKQYIYLDNGTWTTVSTLPSTIAVDRKRRVTVYSDVPQVWQYNPEHIAKYQNQPDNYPKGKAVGYKGTNPNKAKGRLEHQSNHAAKAKVKVKQHGMHKGKH